MPFLLLFFLVQLAMLSPPATAQTGEKKEVDQARGLEFTIPAGWRSEQNGSGYTLIGQDASHVILLLYHRSSSMAELEREAAVGLNSEGIVLSQDGGSSRFGASGITAEYSGTINGEDARACAVGLLAPGGGGVTVISLSPAELYSAGQRTVAESIARSVRFTGSSLSRQAARWKQRLARSRLVYLTAYTSGTSGGYNERREIALCDDGRFSLAGESVVSLYGSDVTGGGTDRDQAEGTWTVAAGLGEVILELREDNGSVRRFGITEQGKHVVLDGTAYMLAEDNPCP